MTPRFRRGACVALALLLGTPLAPALHAQLQGGAAELGNQLRERYEVVALQDGVGLVPRQNDRGIGIIQIRDGAVAIDGEEVTGGELRERLGDDADLVLRVSYLGLAEQRQLAQAPSTPPDPAPPAPTVPEPPEPPGAPEPPEPPDAANGRTRIAEVVRIGGDVRVEADEVVEGEVAAIMGSATVDGEVEGDVTVVMGTLTLGPQAVVHGEVNVVGGSIDRAPTARVEGAIHNVGLGGGDWRDGPVREAVRNAFVWRIGGLAATLMRVVLLLLLALVVVAFGPGVVERIADRTATDAMRAGLVGFFAELLFVPLLVITAVVLAVSIIGIPLLVLLPFGILLALVVLLVGFTGVAYQVGRVLHARFGWTRGPYASVALGVVVIVAVTVLARSAAILGGDLLGWPLVAIGYLVEYAAWTIGCGAAILVWLRGRRPGMTVPAMP